MKKKNWSAKAAAASMNLNEYIRRCVERRTLPPVIPEVNRQTAAAFLSNCCEPQSKELIGEEN